MLHVHGLTKSYGDRQVLAGVDLHVAPGQVIGLVGANGAGKTTLISIVAGLRRPDAGTIHVAGIDALASRARAARHVGLAPQALGIYPTMSARANLQTFAELAGLRPREARARVAEVAELLDLTDRLDEKAELLSGGQQRRLHTGMAVLHRPDLLFLDEPTVGADVSSRAGILDVVTTMAAAGTAVVYTTHYLTELEQLGADIAVLDGGRVVATGPVRDIVEEWGTTSVRLTFTGAAPALDGWTCDGSDLVLSGRTLDAGAAAGGALARLGSATSRLVEVQITPSSLESAFLTLTGRSDRPDHSHPSTHDLDLELSDVLPA